MIRLQEFPCGQDIIRLHAGRGAGNVVDGEALHPQPHPLFAPHRLLPLGLCQ
jgi:hypothetical protein